MPEQEQKEFEITTTAQVERTYIVKGTDDEHAHKRLLVFLKDPDMTREGLVVEQEDKRRDTTPQRVNGKKAVTPKPRTPAQPST